MKNIVIFLGTAVMLTLYGCLIPGGDDTIYHLYQSNYGIAVISNIEGKNKDKQISFSWHAISNNKDEIKTDNINIKNLPDNIKLKKGDRIWLLQDVLLEQRGSCKPKPVKYTYSYLYPDKPPYISKGTFNNLPRIEYTVLVFPQHDRITEVNIGFNYTSGKPIIDRAKLTFTTPYKVIYVRNWAWNSNYPLSEFTSIPTNGSFNNTVYIPKEKYYTPLINIRFEMQNDSEPTVKPADIRNVNLDVSIKNKCQYNNCKLKPVSFFLTPALPQLLDRSRHKDTEKKLL